MNKHILKFKLALQAILFDHLPYLNFKNRSWLKCICLKIAILNYIKLKIKITFQASVFFFMGYPQVVFSVTLGVRSCPPKGQEMKTIKIKPVGLHDTLTVNVRIKCQCDCDSDQKMVSFGY